MGSAKASSHHGLAILWRLREPELRGLVKASVWDAGCSWSCGRASLLLFCLPCICNVRALGPCWQPWIVATMSSSRRWKHTLQFVHHQQIWKMLWRLVEDNTDDEFTHSWFAQQMQTLGPLRPLQMESPRTYGGRLGFQVINLLMYYIVMPALQQIDI